jgi:phosphoglycerol transferase MdoB-like AlkP superfamily enzyme
MKKPARLEALILLAFIGLTAGWFAHLGTLPGRVPLVTGPLGAALGWACMFGGLVLGYQAANSGEQGFSRRLLGKIGLGFLLALLSTQLCRLLAATLVSPMTWDHLFYLRRMVPLGLVAFWCAALLPGETRALFRALRTKHALAPLPELAVLLFSAALLVSGADLAFEWSGPSSAGATLKSDVIYTEAWTANVLVLFSAYGLVFAATRRLWTALLLISPLHIALALATLVKVRHMHVGIQPLDLLRIPELLPFLQSFLGLGILAATAGALGIWIIALAATSKAQPSPISAVRRWPIGLLSLAVLLAFPVAFFRANSLPEDVEYSSFTSADALLSRFRVRGREFKEMARLRGVLMSFISELPGAFASAPPHYSASAVTSTVSRYCRAGPTGKPQGGINLIVYLVESLMDPADLGVKYTSDPIPTLRALRRAQVGGYGIVPEEFGGSANTEFEALTGMTTSFLPEGSVAYRLYLRQPIPSLPRTLAELGYATTAIQADPKHFYDRERAYGLLGFDSVVWLGDDPNVERDPRGWWPSDRAVVDAVIRTSRGAHPFFVFAFPSSTHFPYNGGFYRTSDLDVLDPFSRDVAGELKEYVNTLRVADRAIGTLVDHFRHQPDSTIIAVFGDHLPPLPENALRGFFSRISDLSQLQRARMRRRVPLLIWANFALPHEEDELSINALPTYLLGKMGISPRGFLAVSDTVRRRLPVMTKYAQRADGSLWSLDSLPADERRLVEDYRLLQYDILLGKRFWLRDSATVPPSCTEAMRMRQVSSP